MVKSGIEINSLYIPSEWGKDSFMDLVSFNRQDSETFWPKAFQIIKELGLDGFEMTSGIGSVQSALLWKQNAEDFKKELDNVGLIICSIFYSGLVSSLPFHADYSGKWKSPKRKREILSEIRDLSDFAEKTGCRYLVLGVPMRNEFANKPIIIDEAFRKELADLINTISETAQKRGITCLLHTESNSVFWNAKDIRELMELVISEIGFCPDTAHLIGAGEDPVVLTEPYYKKMAAFHWGDCVGRIPNNLDGTNGIFLAHIPYKKAVGEGIMNHTEWVEFLQNNKYDGWVIFEIPADNGLEGVTMAVSYGKSLLY